MEKWLLEFRQVDPRQIIALVEHWDPDLATSLNDIRQAVIRRVDPRRDRPGSWQEAWNSATGADPRRPGRIEFHTHRTCPECRGRRFSMRTAQVCHRCMGRGRTYDLVLLTTRAAKVPVAAADDPATV